MNKTEAEELAESLVDEVAGINSWTEPRTGCLHSDLLEKYDRANSILQRLVLEYPCNSPKVKLLLYRTLEDMDNPGGVSGLKNALFYALHGLGNHCMTDPNVRLLIQRVYRESQGRDLGRAAENYLIEAGIALPNNMDQQEAGSFDEANEAWVYRLRDHPAIVIIGIVASIISIVAFFRG
ncbi:MAG: hypothetical protein H6945_01785 [Zoogloeaceae bacterium]|nr:hypothetical protein [Zoogloeaceae bacterium]